MGESCDDTWSPFLLFSPLSTPLSPHLSPSPLSVSVCMSLPVPLPLSPCIFQDNCFLFYRVLLWWAKDDFTGVDGTVTMPLNIHTCELNEHLFFKSNLSHIFYCINTNQSNTAGLQNKIIILKLFSLIFETYSWYQTQKYVFL